MVAGAVAVLLCELLVAMLWVGTLCVLHASFVTHLRWLALAFVPAALLLRSYAKKAQRPAATKGAIITLFVTFLLFIVIYLRLT